MTETTSSQNPQPVEQDAEPASGQVEGDFEREAAYTHKRRLHRLRTARWTIFLGLFFLLALCLSAYLLPWLFPGAHNDSVAATADIIGDGITLAGTIVTLALGFIAGSNIE